MISKKALLVLAFPLTFSSVYARNAAIPREEVLLNSFTKNESVYVLRDAKGTIMQASLAGSPSNWFNLSPVDGSEGVRTEETYVQFGAEGSEVIVAVVDSGVDVNHEDLQGKIWTNKGEIPNNGIDDDKNGYIDDVFGWNFIGGAKGMATIVDDSSLSNGIRLVEGDLSQQVNVDNLELTREHVRMKKLKREVEELGEDLTAIQAAYFTKLDTELKGLIDTASSVVSSYSKRLQQFRADVDILKAAGLTTVTLEAVRALESSDPVVLLAKKDLIAMLTNNLSEARMVSVIDSYTQRLNFHYNESIDTRRDIVGDDSTNVNEKSYGNNDVIGPDAHHGTHVSGIIAARRDNSIGSKGVATNVKIMAVRVVPNGDERDKDVANGIRYAVDNGAKIINMSFGKAYSPRKSVVDEAIKYAESKGVLMVHAAGNDSKNNDLIPSFPTRADLKNVQFTNWLDIGASAFQKGPSLPAVFSNYGKKTVDFFAPGVDITSTLPGNKYGSLSGTSMATPVVAGVAALLLSNDPSMTAEALRSLMIDTSRRYPKLQVKIPGGQVTELFSELSTYGSVVDAFEGMKAIRN